MRAQSPAHLTVSVSGNNLIAGYNNTVTISVVNNYIGYIAIYDVDISLSVPAPLALITDNHRHYDSIGYGQNVTVKCVVYAPFSAIGTPQLGSVSGTYKQLGDVSYTEEVHNVGFSVNGSITLVLYGILSAPTQITPGGNTTISGNLLNSGNLAAYDANVTVESNLLTLPAPGANSVFIGEIDPNIPRPFSLLVVFKQNIPVGNYTLIVNVAATDYNRQGAQLVGQAHTPIQVVNANQVSGFRRQRGPTGLMAEVIAILRSLFDVFFGASYP